MIFTKADRARMELIDAKLDAIQSHIKGCTMVGLRTEITNLVPMLDKLMQSHAALSIQLSGTGDGLAREIAILRENYSRASDRLARLIDILSEGAKPKKPRKRKK